MNSRHSAMAAETQPFNSENSSIWLLKRVEHYLTDGIARPLQYEKKEAVFFLTISMKKRNDMGVPMIFSWDLYTCPFAKLFS